MGKQKEPYQDARHPSHKRVQPSIGHSGQLIPANQYQYGEGDRYHSRQPSSQQPHAAVPYHMRRTPMGHQRDFSTASSIDPFTSPSGATRGTPAIDQLPVFPYDQTAPPLRPGSGRFIVVPGAHGPSGRPPSRLGPSAPGPMMLPAPPHRLLPSHGGEQDAENYPPFGSPGPIIYSPNPLALGQKFTGLTPYLNFSVSPYVDPDDNKVPHRLKRQFEEAYEPIEAKRIRMTENNEFFDVPVSAYNDPNVTLKWSEDDTQDLLDLLENAERYKWRYISDQLYTRNDKRIPGLACSRKFKDLFGVPEASSRLGTSLFYVALRSGWQAIHDSKTQVEKQQEGPER